MPTAGASTSVEPDRREEELKRMLESEKTPCVMCMLEPPIEGPTFVGKWTNFVCGVCGPWGIILCVSLVRRVWV